jgi:hypothetical protein
MSNRTTLKSALAAKPGCLSLQELERLAEDSSQGHPHLTVCPRCQSELAMLKAFESSTPLPDEGAAVAWINSQLKRWLDEFKNPGTEHRDAQAGGASPTGWLARLFRTGNARWLVPVAAVLVAAVASVVFLQPARQPDLRADAGSGPAVYRSQEVEIVALPGELPQAPKTLQWKRFAGAANYKVSVMEVDHEALWAAETNDISITIPVSTRGKLLPGKPVLWQVTALDSQGRVLAVSQVQRFSVARKSSASMNRSLPQ